MRKLAVAAAMALIGCNAPTSSDPTPTPTWGPALPPPAGYGVLQIGAEHAIIFWPDLPVVIYGGAESLVLRRVQTFNLDRQHEIVSIRTFIGWDRGDIGEAHIIVIDHKGVPIYSRSVHRQNGYDENYDAFDLQEVPVPSTTDTLTVDLLVRCTGQNDNPQAYKRSNPLSVFFDATVTVFYK